MFKLPLDFEYQSNSQQSLSKQNRESSGLYFCVHKLAFWLLSLGDEIFTFEMSLEFGLSVWSRFLDGALIASPSSGEEMPQGPFSPPLRPCATRRHQNFLTPHSAYQINFTSLPYLRGQILRTLADRVCKDYLVLICNILIFFKNVDLE